MAWVLVGEVEVEGRRRLIDVSMVIMPRLFLLGGGYDRKGFLGVHLLGD